MVLLVEHEHGSLFLRPSELISCLASSTSPKVRLSLCSSAIRRWPREMLSKNNINYRKIKNVTQTKIVEGEGDRLRRMKIWSVVDVPDQ